MNRRYQTFRLFVVYILTATRDPGSLRLTGIEELLAVTDELAIVDFVTAGHRPTSPSTPMHSG